MHLASNCFVRLPLVKLLPLRYSSNMDISKDKLLHKWLDVIESAQDKGMTPEQVIKFVKGWKAKTPAEIDRKIYIGLSAYIGHDPNYKNPTDSIIRFIKSADFKLMIPKSMAVKKKFYTGEQNIYVTDKKINKRLTVPEQRRFKFVENIWSKRWKEFKKHGVSMVGLGIIGILKQRLHKNKKR